MLVHHRTKLKSALYEKYDTLILASEDLRISYTRLTCFLSGTICPSSAELERLEKSLGKPGIELDIEKGSTVRFRLRYDLIHKFRSIRNVSKILRVPYGRIQGIIYTGLKPTEAEKKGLKTMLGKPLDFYDL